MISERRELIFSCSFKKKKTTTYNSDHFKKIMSRVTASESVCDCYSWT